ncbi:MAG: hypothetical protein ACI8WB_001731 [Phenylobacterium sp.]
MGFEQDIAALVTANDDLTAVVDDQIEAIGARVTLGEQQVITVIDTARGEMPFYRLTRNQRLLGTDQHIPDDWNSGAGTTYTLVQLVAADKIWADRTVEERELLTAMGKEGLRYIPISFNMWRMDWTTKDTAHTMHQHVNVSTPSTLAGMTKMLSGAIGAYWANGATNKWTLSGQAIGSWPNGYTYCHPVKQSTSGSMLFALPAAIVGNVPLDPTKWGIFPYIGDTQHD